MPFPIPAGRIAVAAEINDAFYKMLVNFTSQSTVATDEGTATTTYVDLATVGPSVSVASTGTVAWVWVSSQLYSTAAGGGSVMSFAISGATTLAAADANACGETGSAGVAFAFKFGELTRVAINAGTNLYTAKYRADTTGTMHAKNRKIIVFAP